MEILLQLIVVAVAYTFLRRQGGTGLTIKAKLPPANTPEGKKARIQAAIVLLLLLIIEVIVATKNKRGALKIALAVVACILIVLLTTIRKKRT